MPSTSSTPKRNPPFRAEHLGSLLRPEKLLQKRADVDAGNASPAELRAVEDESVREVVQMQKDAGFHGISDGEYRRHMFWGTFFTTSLHGMTEVKNPATSLFRTYHPSIAAYLQMTNNKPGESVVCTGKISHTGRSDNLEQFEYLKTLLPEEQWGNVKLTLPAPEWYHMRLAAGKAYPQDVYAGDEEYFKDLAEAYRRELELLYEAGLRNVQIDDPSLAYFCSDKFRQDWANDPDNHLTFDRQFEAYIALQNKCIENLPSDLHVGIHLCRGNFAGSLHFATGSYDSIARTLFRTLKVSTYYLEYDTPRAGGFEPLKHLPKNKNVILGVVTSKSAELEEKSEMVERVRKAAEFVAEGDIAAAAGDGGGGGGVGGVGDVGKEGRRKALERLGVSAQCGFASHSKGNDLSYGDMVAKLRLVREIADEVWPGEA
ncbi:MAG: hypothetical protein M1831_002292 [Alyxoria varia]|nr:MAG: hypothetical protein M1831_002292 [Alyxoria varia]